MRGLWILMALALASCASGPATTAMNRHIGGAHGRPPGPPPPTIDGGWSLALMRDALTPHALGATLIFDRDRVTGRVACRTFSAKTLGFGLGMAFDQIAEGAPACAAADPSSQRFFEALGATRHASLRSGYLVLADGAGRERLFFRRTSQPAANTMARSASPSRR